MGPAYLARRRDLAANVLRVAAMLQLPYDVAHDAVQLLDRLMSAAPQLREDLLVMASVTALRMLAIGAASGSGGDEAGGSFLQNVLRQPLQGASGGSCGTGTGGGLRGAGIHAQYEAELDARLAQVREDGGSVPFSCRWPPWLSRKTTALLSRSCNCNCHERALREVIMGLAYGFWHFIALWIQDRPLGNNSVVSTLLP